MSKPTLWQFVLSAIGAVPTEDFVEQVAALEKLEQVLARKQDENDELTKKVGQLKENLGKANASLDAANSEVESLGWSNPYRVEFLAGRETVGTEEFIRRSVESWKRFGTGDALGAPWAFGGGKNPAGLYWALTHASKAVQASAKLLNNENGVTATFVLALERELKLAQRLIGASIDLFATEIHKKLKPALKEGLVGADLLLLVSGTNLVPKGGVRLLWLQFKLAGLEDDSLVLDVHRPPNRMGGTQLGALRSVHQPAKGSLGLYALASIYRPYMGAIPVADLSHVDPGDKAACQIDLASQGLRLQELILDLTTDPKAGQFDTKEVVMAFVDGLAARSAIVPLHILSVSSGDELIPSKSLAMQIKDGMDRRLRARIDALTREQKRDYGIEEDRGPSLGR